MSPESLKAYHAANPSLEQEIADLRTRLQTAEQQLGQVREEVKGWREAIEDAINHDGGNRYNYREITEVLTGALSATPSDGCGKKQP